MNQRLKEPNLKDLRSTTCTTRRHRLDCASLFPRISQSQVYIEDSPCAQIAERRSSAQPPQPPIFFLGKWFCPTRPTLVCNAGADSTGYQVIGPASSSFFEASQFRFQIEAHVQVTASLFQGHKDPPAVILFVVGAQLTTTMTRPQIIRAGKKESCGRTS